MKKSTLLILTVMVGLSVFAQKGNYTIKKSAVSQNFTLSTPTKGSWEPADTLVPASFTTGTPTVMQMIIDGEDYGFVAGANAYGDEGKAQQYTIENKSYVKEVIIWVGANSVTEGDLTFKVWDFKGDTLSTVLASKAVPFAQVSATTGADFYYSVQFDQPVAVEGNFVVGVEFKDITTGFGLVSTTPGDAGQTNLAWELLGEMLGGVWSPINVDWQDGTGDIDFGIFPVIANYTANNEAEITAFNVDGQVGETIFGNGTIDIDISADVNTTSLTTTFTLSEGATAKIGDVAQVSATTVDFSAGSVTFTVIAEDGETTKDWVVTVHTLGVNDQSTIEASVYPNPAIETLNIETVNNATVNIMNILGITIEKITLDGTFGQINVSKLPAGTYYVIIESKGNRTVKKVSIIR